MDEEFFGRLKEWKCAGKRIYCLCRKLDSVGNCRGGNRYV